MKKLPMLLLLIVPYGILILCSQTNMDFSTGLTVYGAILAFNAVYAFRMPRLGFNGKQLLFWNLLLKLCNIPLVFPRRTDAAPPIGRMTNRAENGSTR